MTSNQEAELAAATNETLDLEPPAEGCREDCDMSSDYYDESMTETSGKENVERHDALNKHQEGK